MACYWSKTRAPMDTIASNVRTCARGGLASTSYAVLPAARPRLHGFTTADYKGHRMCRISSRRGLRVLSVTPAISPQAASAAAGSSTESSTKDVSTSEQLNASPRQEAKLTLDQYKQIYDRLIKVFSERPREDWKKLIVFSKQWPEHVNGVFARIKELADLEPDVDKKMALRKTFRALQGVHQEVTRYNVVLEKFTSAADDEWDAIVATNRGDLQRAFFEHMQCLLVANKDNAEKYERLMMVNTRLVALCASHDSIAGDPEALERAALVYRDLLSSIGSIEDADKKMAELGAAGKIDPAFLQITARAYGAARDTNMPLDEAKWVAYKLYRNAKDYFDRQQPKEKRIIEYLMTMTDRAERSRQLDMAVTPGPQPWTDTHDYMYSTPQRLFVVLDNTLKAYGAMRDQAKIALNTPEAAILPPKVRIMRELRDEILRRYL